MKADLRDVRLDDVCEIASVLVDPRKAQYQDMIHVGGANIQTATGELTDLKTAREEELKSGKFLFDESMVLYSKIRPYLMKVARPDFRGLCSADIYPLSPDRSQLERNYLYYLLLTAEFTEFAIAGSARAGMPKVNREHLFTFRLSLPSVPEQRRLVGILDEAFEGIATAKANAEKNLQNARALFESHLQSVFTARGEGWQTQSLADVCCLFVDSAHRTPKYQEDGIPALRPRDVVGGRLDLTGAARVSLEECAVQSKRYAPAPGDIVYSRELSYGWGAIVPSSPRVCLSQGMCVFRPSPEIDSAFLLYVLNGPVGREQATHAAVGASHPHINLGDIKAYRIPMPALREQKQLVKQIDSIAAETTRLASIYQRKLAALDELKKSLLHQAFSGQL